MPSEDGDHAAAEPIDRAPHLSEEAVDLEGAFWQEDQVRSIVRKFLGKGGGRQRESPHGGP